MHIKGFEKTTLIDYPGHIASIIFTGGCNFRCDFCYNQSLVHTPHALPSIAQDEVLTELAARAAFIDGVVITGGEPTLQLDLSEFIHQIRALNLKIKLDTNGYSPEKVQELFEQKIIDYIAMDIKGPFSRYTEITGIPIDTAKIKRSIELIMNAGIDYEFRTTVWHNGFTHKDFDAMLGLIAGARHYYLQNMFPMFATPTKINYKPMLKSEISPLFHYAQQRVQHCGLRGEWR